MRITPRSVFFKNVFLAVGIIFLLVSSIFMGVSGAMFANALYFKKNGVAADAVIKDIRGQDVWIRYSTDEEDFSGPLGYYSSSMRIGAVIPIHYDRNNPGRIHADGSEAIGGVFMGVSLLLFITGRALVAGFQLMDIRKWASQRRVYWLLEHGTQIQANITGVEVDRSMSSNCRHPYVLVCQRRMTDGLMRLFYSGHIWYDPTNSLTANTVTVFLDPKDNRKYYVDLSSVLPDENRDGRHAVISGDI